jgi:hypothetical protein
MKFASVLMTVLLLSSFAMGLIVVGCEDEGDEYRRKPMMQDDGENYAKDKDADGRCDVEDYVIQDCLDACTCCHQGSENLIETCVEWCDDVLIRYQDYPPAHTYVDDYKECVVGCFSVCEPTNRDEICWNECKGYLEGA